MTAVELAPKVWRIPTKPYDLINSFLLEDEDGSLTLVDAGLRGGDKKVLTALLALGKNPGDVTRILLTHAHSDHAGGLQRTAQATGARVLSHDREASYLREGKPPTSDRSTAGGRLMARLPGKNFARVEVAETFADGAVLPIGGGLTVVHTPGHSPGHCSFLHTGSGTLITGDAIFNVRGLRYAPSMTCTDLRQNRASAARLGELDYGTVAFTHGAPVTVGARQAVRAFLAGRPC